MTDKEKQKGNDDILLKQGYFKDGIPYTRIGNKPHIIIDLEGLSWVNAPASGIYLKENIKSYKESTQDYTIYHVGRKPGLPKGYTLKDMANDYAIMIRNEFKSPVDIMGISTGGQIALFLAADHPDIIRKLIIISAAYRASEICRDAESRAADFAKQGKYGKSVVALLDIVYTSGFKKFLMKFLSRLAGKKMVGSPKDPSDFIIAVEADREIFPIERLSEIKAPALVISGEIDAAYTIEDFRKTADNIPNAELKLFKDYGHNLVFENMKEVLEKVHQFLF